MEIKKDSKKVRSPEIISPQKEANSNNGNMYMEMDTDPLIDSTPGCSKDEKYMSRDKNWPDGSDAISWMDNTQQDSRYNSNKLDTTTTDIMYNDKATNDMYK